MVPVRPIREGQLFPQPIWNLHMRAIMLPGRPQLLSHLHLRNKRLKVALESADTRKQGGGAILVFESKRMDSLRESMPLLRIRAFVPGPARRRAILVFKSKRMDSHLSRTAMRLRVSRMSPSVSPVVRIHRRCASVSPGDCIHAKSTSANSFGMHTCEIHPRGGYPPASPGHQR